MKSSKKLLRGWLAICVVLIASGGVSNAQRKTELKPNAIQANSNVGVIWISPCSNNKGCKENGSASNLGEFVPDGANGLLIYGAVLSAHQEIIDALDQITADPLIEEKFLNPVAAALEARGAIPTINKSFNYQGDIPTIGKHSVMRLRNTLTELHPESSKLYHAFGFDYNFDLSKIAEELDSSTLVVLHLQHYGVRRSFGPFGVPAGRPYGSSVARAFIWDAATQSVIYNDYGISQAAVGDNWREKGKWTQVLNATDAALALTLDRVTEPLLEALK